MSKDELRLHWARHGESEGRQSSSAASRSGLLDLIEPRDDVLEIGPFTSPTCRGRRVKYFDVLDRPGLVERAHRIGISTEGAVDIDYVSPTGDLSVVGDGTFDVVVSSHCIEHQPDLIDHLNHVARVLRPGGHYLLMIPDKRYCFDHFIAETTVANVIAAKGRRTHTIASVIEHRALTTHNDPARHWLGDHGLQAIDDNPARAVEALVEFEAAAGAYIDVHAWQFTPSALRRLIRQLLALGLIDLDVAAVYSTVKNSHEFTAILRRT